MIISLKYIRCVKEAELNLRRPTTLRTSGYHSGLFCEIHHRNRINSKKIAASATQSHDIRMRLDKRFYRAREPRHDLQKLTVTPCDIPLRTLKLISCCNNHHHHL